MSVRTTAGEKLAMSFPLLIGMAGLGSWLLRASLDQQKRQNAYDSMSQHR
ncbi:MAG: hypothetical protein K6T78_08655 [Alicyclobacillus sp.]|nr:hypothetical protein [Alicyclobacillus sp.]